MLAVLGAPKSGTSVTASACIHGGITFPYCERHPHRLGAGGYPKHESDLVWAYFHRLSQGERWGKVDRWDAEAFRLLMRAMALPGDRTGWKIPQATLYWAEMRETWPDLTFVGVFRHPALVTRHLVDYGYADAPISGQMWDTYAEALIDAHDALGFALFEFGSAFHPDHVQRALGLEVCGDPTFRAGVPEGGPCDNWRYHALRERAT